MDTTTISVSTENWQWLNSLKRPGESFNDVLDRMREGEVEVASNDVGHMPNDLDLPGSGETLKRRRMAIARMYERLKERGTADKSDLLEAVDPDQVEYASKESAWSNLIKGKNTLHSLPGVNPPSEGQHAWRYER